MEANYCSNCGRSLKEGPSWPLPRAEIVPEANFETLLMDIFFDLERAYSPQISRDALTQCIHDLSERREQILTLHYGLDGKGTRTVTEIFRLTGINRAVVKNNLDRALRILRHPSNSKKIEGKVKPPELAQVVALND